MLLGVWVRCAVEVEATGCIGVDIARFRIDVVKVVPTSYSVALQSSVSPTCASTAVMCGIALLLCMIALTTVIQ